MSWLPWPVDGPWLTLHSPWLMQQASLVPSLCLSRAGRGSGPRAVSASRAVPSNRGSAMGTGQAVAGERCSRGVGCGAGQAWDGGLYPFILGGTG